MQQNGRRKPDFQTTGQTYIELTETTANVEHIISVLSQRWGSGYTLVTNDGVPLEDSPATQGLLFISYRFSQLLFILIIMLLLILRPDVLEVSKKEAVCYPLQWYDE